MSRRNDKARGVPGPSAQIPSARVAHSKPEIRREPTETRDEIRRDLARRGLLRFDDLHELGPQWTERKIGGGDGGRYDGFPHEPLIFGLAPKSAGQRAKEYLLKLDDSVRLGRLVRTVDGTHFRPWRAKDDLYKAAARALEDELLRLELEQAARDPDSGLGQLTLAVVDALEKGEPLEYRVIEQRDAPLPDEVAGFTKNQLRQVVHPYFTDEEEGLRRLERLRVEYAKQSAARREREQQEKQRTEIQLVRETMHLTVREAARRTGISKTRIAVVRSRLQRSLL
jgi:hypothetical protein